MAKKNPTKSGTKAKRAPAKSKPAASKPTAEAATRRGPDPRNAARCSAFENEVNAHLNDKRHAKVNALAKCNECEPDDPRCAVLNSPFDASLVNTGHDGAGGIIASGGGTDLCWEAGLGDGSGPSSVQSWIPAFVVRNSAWVASPFANANWISFFADTDHSGNVDVYFRIRLSLNSSIDIAKFFLDMTFYADNSVWDIYVNGTQQSVTQPTLLPQNASSPFGHRGFDRGTGVRIAITDGWQPCMNELVVHVKSGRPKIGFLAQNTSQCYEADLPALAPTVDISWGDSACDCFETDDLEVAYVTVCNPYSNLIFNDFKVGKIRIVNDDGTPVAQLPDGSPSVEIIAPGPHCFGDIQSCTGEPGDNCVSREFAIRTRGAKDGKYKLLLDALCYSVELNYAAEDCFEIDLCKD